MKKNSLILEIFKEWNPLDVPSEITEDEYYSYVKQLLKECKTEKSIYIFLKKMLTESMEVTLANTKAYEDLNKYSNSIYNIIKSFN